MTATVTACDWEYLSGGHVGGGTLSLLHHERLGTLLCAGMSRYTLKEPNNMQVPCRVRQECLAVRIEAEKDGIVYSSLYDDDVRVSVEGGLVTASGKLRDEKRRTLSGREQSYCFTYQVSGKELRIRAEFDDGTLICPLVSGADEAVSVEEDGKRVIICKKNGQVLMESNREMRLPYSTERIFNLIPGLQALRVQINPQAGWAEVGIRVESGEEDGL